MKLWSPTDSEKFQRLRKIYGVSLEVRISCRLTRSKKSAKEVSECRSRSKVIANRVLPLFFANYPARTTVILFPRKHFAWDISRTEDANRMPLSQVPPSHSLPPYCMNLMPQTSHAHAGMCHIRWCSPPWKLVHPRRR